MKEQKIPTTKFTSHSVNMTDRKKAVMTGVAKVDGAESTQIELTTALGRLIVTGKDLKIAKFDEADGNLTLTGDIDCIKYAVAKPPLIKRIFK